MIAMLKAGKVGETTRQFRIRTENQGESGRKNEEKKVEEEERSV